jgi:hypothetical protein
MALALLQRQVRQVRVAGSRGRLEEGGLWALAPRERNAHASQSSRGRGMRGVGLVLRRRSDRERGSSTGEHGFLRGSPVLHLHDSARGRVRGRKTVDRPRRLRCEKSAGCRAVGSHCRMRHGRLDAMHTLSGQVSVIDRARSRDGQQTPYTPETCLSLVPFSRVALGSGEPRQRFQQKFETVRPSKAGGKPLSNRCVQGRRWRPKRARLVAVGRRGANDRRKRNAGGRSGTAAQFEPASQGTREGSALLMRPENPRFVLKRLKLCRMKDGSEEQQLCGDQSGTAKFVAVFGLGWLLGSIAWHHGRSKASNVCLAHRLFHWEVKFRSGVLKRSVPGPNVCVYFLSCRGFSPTLPRGERLPARSDLIPAAPAASPTRLSHSQFSVSPCRNQSGDDPLENLESLMVWLGKKWGS